MLDLIVVIGFFGLALAIVLMYILDPNSPRNRLKTLEKEERAENHDLA